VRMPSSEAERDPGASGRCTVILTDQDPEDKGNGRADPNAWRYFDDIYVDSTFARVVMANSEVYDDATVVEPQIPSIWSDSSVSVTVNLGMLRDGEPMCLFVFDAGNNRSPAYCLQAVCDSDGACDAADGETCSGCPADCPTGIGEICCGGVVFTGECCSAGDCGAGESCTDHRCVPAGEEDDVEREEGAIEPLHDSSVDARPDDTGSEGDGGGEEDEGGGESGCGCAVAR
jgi:hypothetical protein